MTTTRYDKTNWRQANLRFIQNHFRLVARQRLLPGRYIEMGGVGRQMFHLLRDYLRSPKDCILVDLDPKACLHQWFGVEDHLGMKLPNKLPFPVRTDAESPQIVYGDIHSVVQKAQEGAPVAVFTWDSTHLLDSSRWDEHDFHAVVRNAVTGGAETFVLILNFVVNQRHRDLSGVVVAGQEATRRIYHALEKWDQDGTLKRSFEACSWPFLEDPHYDDGKVGPFAISRSVTASDSRNPGESPYRMATLRLAFKTDKHQRTVVNVE